MNNIAIKVENLGKEYRIGANKLPYKTIRETLVNFTKAPFKRIAKLIRGHAYGAADLDEKIWALKDISFEVKRGEVVGIIGQNGAGKSTLLKILSRITDPTEGQAEIYGRVGSLLEVGTGFHPELTGRENVFLNGAVLGMKKREITAKFDEIVDFAGVRKFIDTPVKFYSSGMRMRLAFAVAAHLDTEILLIDEVLAVGDADFQKKCLGKMKDVTGKGRTVLFVSHNMPSIESICNRAILLEKGRITFRGDSKSTVLHYLGKKDYTPQAYSDLRKHLGRTTKTNPVFQNIRLLNHLETETALFQVGDGIIFEMTLDSPGRKLMSPRILISVINSSEMRIAEFYSEEMMAESYEITGRTIVRCCWDECRLVPGKYSLILKIREHGEILDRIYEPLTFEVLPGDVYGTGMIRKSPGVILPKGVWKFKSAFDHDQVTIDKNEKSKEDNSVKLN